MRYRLNPWVAISAGILTVVTAALVEAFFIALGGSAGLGTAAEQSQSSAQSDIAVAMGLAAGLAIVWWAIGLVLEEWVVPHRDRALLSVVGAGLAVAAVLLGAHAVSVAVGVAVVLPLGACWGLLLKQAAARPRP
jgi:hypothetical protein